MKMLKKIPIRFLDCLMLFIVLLCSVGMTKTAIAGWLKLNSGISSNLLSVEFVDDNTGFVGGEQGKLLKSTDRGSTWISVDLGISKNIVVFVQAKSEKIFSFWVTHYLRRLRQAFFHKLECLLPLGQAQ